MTRASEALNVQVVPRSVLGTKSSNGENRPSHLSSTNTGPLPI
jgi:hypothetical protein